MEKIYNKLLIVKYGSNTLVHENVNGGISIDYNNIKNHGLVIDSLEYPAMIVSSGAVAFGRTFNNDFAYIEDEIVKKRILASIGNPQLSMNWNQAIPNKLLLQSLITHRDLTAADTKDQILHVIRLLYKKSNVVIQVNDNDFVTDEELLAIRGGDFGDNDKTTALIAQLALGVFDKVEVVINTSSDGVLENDQLISEIDAKTLSDTYLEELCGLNKSSHGTGGMYNKLKIMRDLVLETDGLSVHIVNGKKPEQLKMICEGKHVGTRIYK